MRTALVSLISVCFLVGCASLDVEVSVISPEQVERETDRRLLRDQLPAALAQTELDVYDDFDRMSSEHFTTYKALTAEYLAAAADLDEKAKGDPSIESGAETLRALAAGLQSDFSDAWGSRYDEAAALVVAYNQRLRSLAPHGVVPADTREITRALRTRDAVINALIQEILADVSDEETKVIATIQRMFEQHGFSTAQRQSFQAAVAKQEAKLRESLIPNSLLQSPVAYAVVSAPESLWAKRFDYSGGSGAFGNTDIAIKALGPGNFTVKGLSFDPGNVARAASRVGAQALMLAAQISGVPVSVTGSPVGDGAALASSTPRLIQARADREKAQARAALFDDGVLSLAEAIVAERPSIESKNDLQIKESLTAISAIYEAQKAKLSP